MDKWEKEKEKILGALVQKTSVKRLPSLVTLKGYTLDKEQVEIYKKLAIQHNIKHPDPTFNINNLIIPESQTYRIESAGIKQVNCGFIPHIIKCKNLPAEFTTDSLKAFFTPYVTDSKTLYHWYIFGKHTNEPYPYVYIGPNRTGVVYFDPHTNDAQFALVIVKNTPFNHVLPNGQKEVKNIWFNHPFTNDRELPIEINKMSKPHVSRFNTHTNHTNIQSNRTNSH